MEVVRVVDLKWQARNYTVKTTAHTGLVLPLEQLILNAFEKAPSKGERWERPRAKRGQREVKGEKQSKHMDKWEGA